MLGQFVHVSRSAVLVEVTALCMKAQRDLTYSSCDEGRLFWAWSSSLQCRRPGAAGDTSCNEALMLASVVDGVSADEQVSRATLNAIRAKSSDRGPAHPRSPAPVPGLQIAVPRGAEAHCCGL
ncbi:MAG: hypothetical protein KGK16_05440 [Bradyrhizobium sp.]|nr:hypothetical protein [Bradyrhizobium sp.]